MNTQRDAKGNVIGITTMEEKDKAALSKKRGEAAAQVPASQRAGFIAAQGKAEEKGKGTATESDYSHLDKEADDTAATSGQNLAVTPKYHDGIDNVPKTGPAILKKGEAVLNTKDAGKYRKSQSMHPLREAISGLGQAFRNIKGPQGTAASEANATAWKNGGAAAYEKANPVDVDKPISSTPAPGSAAAMAPKYHDGIDNVPKTGPAILKKGEAVLNTKDAEKHRKSKELLAQIMGLGSSKPEADPAPKEKAVKKVKDMHIRRGASGGYIAKHTHDSADHSDEEHVLPDHKALIKHITEHMHDAPMSDAPEPQAESAGQ